MTASAPAARLIAGASLLAALASGCAPSDPPDSAAAMSVPVTGGAAGNALPPVSLPDLSNLAEWAQDQVRARDGALRALQDDPSAGSESRGDGP